MDGRAFGYFAELSALPSLIPNEQAKNYAVEYGGITELYFNSRIGNASSCPWKRHFTPKFHWVKQFARCGGPA